MEGCEHCYSHDPGRANERRRNASKGGRSGGRGRPHTETDGLKTEIRDLKKQLEDLARDVLAGTVDRGNAVVVNQILNTRLRLAELERRQEAGDHNLTPQELESFVATVVDIVGRHLPPERLRGFVEEIGQVIGEG
ncbi:MAG: hypothetical protein M3R38_25880 [Actinomycetota bacterium]|nr:hypothetical protein [Actinomycetota bacterium]